MGSAAETLFQASRKNFSAPDGAVVTVAGSIKAHSDHGGIPFAALGKHRTHMGAMMLHGNFAARRQ
jgi:hypothetical protein